MQMPLLVVGLLGLAVYAISKNDREGLMKLYSFLLFFTIFMQIASFVASFFLFIFVDKGYIFGIIALWLVLVLFLVGHVVFSKYTNKYPKNSYKDYAYSPNSSLLGYVKDGIFDINITQDKNGYWIISNGDRKLAFDLTGYWFPKAYICAFFVRNLHYSVVNKKKLQFAKFFHSLSLLPYKKFKSMNLTFHYGEKIKKIKIVKNYKTKISILQYFILRSNYYLNTFAGVRFGTIFFRKEKITEKQFIVKYIDNPSKKSVINQIDRQGVIGHNEYEVD